jgi:hypothetical protein
MVVFYMVSPRVKRSLVYGPAPRNRLDLYLPPGGTRAAPVPVVIYITGARRAPAPGRRRTEGPRRPGVGDCWPAALSGAHARAPAERALRGGAGRQ